MTVAEAARVYEQGAWRAVAGGVLRPGGLALTDRAFAVCALSAGARVLDIGCGAAVTVAHLIDRYSLAAFGIDLSAALLREGRQRDPAPALAQACGEDLPIGDAQLDAVLAECSLSVIGDASRALSEFRRVLIPRGWLIMSDVYARNPGGLAALRCLPPEACLWGALAEPQLITLVQDCGFEIVLWEDHSNALKTFVAQWIFTHGALPPFWGCASSDQQYMLSQSKPGYFLLMARKSDGRL